MTVKTDDKKRVVLPSAKPGDVFDVQIFDAGRIVLTRLVPAGPKLVRPRKVKGIVMGSAEVEIDPDEIVRAIQTDREAR